MAQKQAKIAIKKIKDVEFSINEAIELTDTTIVNIRFDLTTNMDLSENTVELLLTTTFSESSDDRNIIMKIKTSNVFLLQDLRNYYNSESKVFNIPDSVVITFLSLSISHSRALLSKNTLGTKYADKYIPIVNPTDVFNQLFKK